MVVRQNEKYRKYIHVTGHRGWVHLALMAISIFSCDPVFASQTIPASYHWRDASQYVVRSDLIVVGKIVQTRVTEGLGRSSEIKVQDSLFGHVAGEEVWFDFEAVWSKRNERMYEKFSRLREPGVALWFLRMTDSGRYRIVTRPLRLHSLTKPVIDAFVASLDAGVRDVAPPILSETHLAAYDVRRSALRNFLTSLRGEVPLKRAFLERSSPYRNLLGLQRATLADSLAAVEYIETVLGVSCPLKSFMTTATYPPNLACTVFTDARNDTVSICVRQDKRSMSYGYLSIERPGRGRVEVAPASTGERAIAQCLFLYSRRSLWAELLIENERK